MKWAIRKTCVSLAAVGCLPFLVGANGGGCQPASVNPGGLCMGVDGGPCAAPPPVVDASPEDAAPSDAAAATDGGACVSSQGEHCGGNTAHPCTCAPGLTCTPGDSGLPFGDVGGTCEAKTCLDNVLCKLGTHWDPAACACEPDDAGSVACVSAQGGPCGGNTAHPCSCAAGLTCTPGDSGLPFGDVGGTCETSATTCTDTVLCQVGTQWDPATCACEPTCTTAADCHGALPQLCEQCSGPTADGGAPGFGCAHFECRAGFCVTAFCD